MKRIFAAIAAIGLWNSTNAQSAQPLSQGTVTYQVQDATEGMPATATLKFNKTRTRWEWKSKDETEVQIVQPDANTGGVLYSEKGAKYFNPFEEGELLYYTAPSVRESKNTAEKTTVAGVPATRFNLVLQDPVSGDMHETDAWIDVTTTSTVPSIGGIPGKMGLPLDFEMRYNGSTLHLKATAISKTPVDAALFTIPKGLSKKEESKVLQDPPKLREGEPVQSK